jgi:hypothetical protein
LLDEKSAFLEAKILLSLKGIKSIVMTTIELKKLLIHRITEINDVSFLKAVKTILDSKTNSEVLLLTPEQRREIMESKKEIEQGLYIENESLDKEVSKWASAR